MRSKLHSRSMRLIAALLVVLACAAAAVTAMARPAHATTLKTFTTAGTYVWTVPSGVTAVTFDVYGARGGSVISSSNGIVYVISSGGAGGEAKAKFAVKAGEVFEIVVGGQGGNWQGNGTNGAPGFNGGGVGTTLSAGGGGASDVRIGGRGNSCAHAQTCTYADRIVVAGGGGGGANQSNGGDGFAGGGLTGAGSTCSSSSTGVSAAQECGGASSATCENDMATGGQFGTGGAGCQGSISGGGGGGGWYGGGSLVGGGGGSGYIGRFSLGGSFPGGIQQGDGKVIITT